jgi:hypothetical protein
MAKRWQPDDDAFLLKWHNAAGADFVASHDLGRPDGAGSRRLKALDKCGASVAFAKARLADLDWLKAAGHYSAETIEDEREFWTRNLRHATARAPSKWT